jgi:type II secretory pathway pseudopilin PulG
MLLEPLIYLLAITMLAAVSYVAVPAMLRHTADARSTQVAIRVLRVAESRVTTARAVAFTLEMLDTPELAETVGAVTGAETDTTASVAVSSDGRVVAVAIASASGSCAGAYAGLDGVVAPFVRADLATSAGLCVAGTVLDGL